MLIALEREGTFSVHHTRTNKNQCGNRGMTVLHYRVKVEGRPEDLNSNGYLLDNNTIPNYFARKYRNIPNFLSCEQIARTAVGDLCAQVNREGGHCRRLCVSIQAIPGSWITADSSLGGERLAIVA